jgi:alcohol dehydrogenase
MLSARPFHATAELLQLPDTPVLPNFQFSTVADIQFGSGITAQLGSVASDLGIRRAFVVTDPGIQGLGLLESGLKSLQEHRIEPSIFSGIVADPPESVVLGAVDAALEAGCDGVIGFGGGSSMDAAKLVAVLLRGDQKLADMYGVDQVTNGRLPLIQVPTTAGTGSEVTPIAIVTTGETTKAGVVSHRLLADCVILDPQLTLGLPPHVTAATGIDAMVHAIEAYTSKHLKNPTSDMLSRQALQLMATNIEAAVFQGDDLQARGSMLLGAMYAGQAFANAPVAAVHALAYPLGGIYHVPHGLSNSLVLPHVLNFNASRAAPLYRQLAPIILQRDDVPADAETATMMLADHFEAMAKKFGLQTQLSQLNIPEDGLPELASQAMQQQRLLVNNPKEVLYEDALNIYHQAY